MYPKIYLDLFRDFERTDEVFVAMPFADQFEPRWESVFCPGIEDANLKPHRVDVRQISDSILTDVLAGIGRARLVLVDISFQHRDGAPIGPNANVMYELGIAHAMRLPEEVIVVRDKSSIDPSPFDIGHIRYMSFDTRNTRGARATIRKLLVEANKAIDLTKDMIVERTLRALDFDGMHFLGTVGSRCSFDLYLFDLDRKGLYDLGARESSQGELRNVARALMSLGLLTAADPGPPEKRVYGAVPEYRVTPLGKAVWESLPDWCKEPRD